MTANEIVVAAIALTPITIRTVSPIRLATIVATSVGMAFVVIAATISSKGYKHPDGGYICSYGDKDSN